MEMDQRSRGKAESSGCLKSGHKGGAGSLKGFRGVVVVDPRGPVWNGMAKRCRLGLLGVVEGLTTIRLLTLGLTAASMTPGHSNAGDQLGAVRCQK